jgi:hypothetical protein
MRSAYGRQTPPPDYELTCVEPGSPMGELLRRYWQPVCTSDELNDLPKKVRLLCEELVVFRDKKGRVGALEPHCYAPWYFPRVGRHALENLATSDTGIAILRRTLREQIKRVSDGLDPMNMVREVVFNEKIPTNAWNTILPPAEASMFQGEEV